MTNITVPSICRLLKAFRDQQEKKRANVVFTYIECLTRDCRDQSLLYNLLGFGIPKGDPNAAMIDELTPEQDDILISKTACSVFNSTNIEYVLRNLGMLVIMYGEL